MIDGFLLITAWLNAFFQELTGELPVEYPLEQGEQAPMVRKRIGTTFPLSPKIINRDAEVGKVRVISAGEMV